jgi:hypothetical protein
MDWITVHVNPDLDEAYILGESMIVNELLVVLNPKISSLFLLGLNEQIIWGEAGLFFWHGVTHGLDHNLCQSRSGWG